MSSMMGAFLRLGIEVCGWMVSLDIKLQMFKIINN